MLGETEIAQYQTKPHPMLFQRASPYRSHAQVAGEEKVGQRQPG